MDVLEILGLVAGICTSTASLPQIISTIKTKKASEVSPFMFIVLLAGNVLWTWYGLQKNDLPIIATNVLAVILDLVMLYLRFRYRKNK
ncbi:SemiSWEET transporter [uncultured Mucilaginibacter sp.]|uniref:SemiSWEET family sugar transporter n=1 Tax=uncultured Mucilaginibacter sp. TaxID=797541 RepID=UPI0025FE949F|nr:SemiSWEET transporter [uncultured Mucilaginibacter sp.]